MALTALVIHLFAVSTLIHQVVMFMKTNSAVNKVGPSLPSTKTKTQTKQSPVTIYFGETDLLGNMVYRIEDK